MQASPVTSSFFLSSLIRGTVGNICKTCFGLRHRKASKEASKQASKYTSKKGRKEESKKPRKEGMKGGNVHTMGGHEYLGRECPGTIRVSCSLS